MSNTIKVQSAGVPALFFIINELGEKVGQEWQEGGALDAHAKAQIEKREGAVYFDADGVLELHKWLALHKERKAAYEANNQACEALDVKGHELLGEMPEPLHIRFKEQGGVYEVTASPKGANQVDDYLYHADIIAIYEAWESGAGVKGIFKGPFKKSDGQPCPIPNIEKQYNYYKAREAFNQEHGVKALEAENTALHDALSAAELYACFAPAKTLHDLALKAEIVAQVCDPIRGECGYERAILDGMTRDTTRLAIQHLNLVQEVVSEGAE